MVQTVCRTSEIPKFYFDTVIDVPVVLVVRVHRCHRGEDSRAPTVALGEKLVLASVNTAEVSAVTVSSSTRLQLIVLLSCRVDFSGPCAEAHGQGVMSTGTDICAKSSVRTTTTTTPPTQVARVLCR